MNAQYIPLLAEGAAKWMPQAAAARWERVDGEWRVDFPSTGLDVGDVAVVPVHRASGAVESVRVRVVATEPAGVVLPAGHAAFNRTLGRRIPNPVKAVMAKARKLPDGATIFDRARAGAAALADETDGALAELMGEVGDGGLPPIVTEALSDPMDRLLFQTAVNEVRRERARMRFYGVESVDEADELEEAAYVRQSQCGGAESYAADELAARAAATADALEASPRHADASPVDASDGGEDPAFLDEIPF